MILLLVELFVFTTSLQNTSPVIRVHGCAHPDPINVKILFPYQDKLHVDKNASQYFYNAATNCFKNMVRLLLTLSYLVTI